MEMIRSTDSWAWRTASSVLSFNNSVLLNPSKEHRFHTKRKPRGPQTGLGSLGRRILASEGTQTINPLSPNQLPGH